MPPPAHSPQALAALKQGADFNTIPPMTALRNLLVMLPVLTPRGDTYADMLSSSLKTTSSVQERQQLLALVAALAPLPEGAAAISGASQDAASAGGAGRQEAEEAEYCWAVVAQLLFGPDAESAVAALKSELSGAMTPAPPPTENDAL